LQIEDHNVVVLHYTLKDAKGTVIDQSNDGSFAYLHGVNNIIPGLECALAGKKAGDELTVIVKPEEGYGLREESKLQEVSKTMFESNSDIVVGSQFHAQEPGGEVLVVTVMEVNDEYIVVDGNHPLAGVELNFDVKVIEVRDASEEEKEHGHVHAAQGDVTN